MLSINLNNQAGKFAGSLLAVCVAGIATKFVLGKICQLAGISTSEKSADANTQKIRPATVNKFIYIASLLAGFAAGVFTANRLGLISLKDLISRVTAQPEASPQFMKRDDTKIINRRPTTPMNPAPLDPIYKTPDVLLPLLPSQFKNLIEFDHFFE